MFLKIMKRSLIVAVILVLPFLFVRRNKSAPEVVETFPKNFSQAVPIDLEAVRFSFDRPMDEKRISYVIKSGNWPEHEERWENGYKTLSIYLHSKLAPQQTYAVALNEGLTPIMAAAASMRDKYENILRPYSLVFVTGSSASMDQKVFDELLDTDKDGLENSLEITIGTDINRLDTDGDGLSDYQEYCKYRTDATKADTDDDGKLDSDWDERREYTHTIMATCQLKAPVDIHAMNDLFQDAKQIREDTYEVVLYLDSTPNLVHTVRSSVNRNIPTEFQKYLKSTFAVNYSEKMLNQITKGISNCKTDWDVLNWIQIQMGQMKVVPLTVGVLDLHYMGDQVVVRDSKDKEREERLNKSLIKHLQETYFADSMFKKKQFSTCASRATLRAGMLRSAGFPTRIAHAVPLLYTTMDEKEELIKGLKSDFLKESIFIAPERGYLIVDHAYNEIYLNNHWIRVDYGINEGVLFGNSKPFIKIRSLLDWSEVNFTETWERKNWTANRPYKTLSVSEQFPMYQSRYNDG